MVLLRQQGAPVRRRGARPASRLPGAAPAAGEFSLTLCAEDQAAVADFAGSFSVADIDKTGSELIRFGEPEATGTPWVRGGVVALECVLRETVRFPAHTLYAGEVVAAHLPAEALRPLVKHGAMHTLGTPVRRTEVVASARWLPAGTLRIAATGPAGDGDGRWRVSLLTADGGTVSLGAHPPSPHGDFLRDLPLPAGLPVERLGGCRVRVERDGAEPGYAAVTGLGARSVAPTAPVVPVTHGTPR